MQNETVSMAQQRLPNTLSDRELSERLQHRDATALDLLYDRYAVMVFTMLSDSRPSAVEALLEDVFLALWRRGTTAAIDDVATTLFHLAIEASRHDQLTGERTDWTTGMPFLIPCLNPFCMLPDPVFKVMLLLCLGKLTIVEVAAALERTEASVRKDVAVAFAIGRALPQLQPNERAVTVD